MIWFSRTYPVYAVGEAGAMYTPASSQYYSPASTPVTYAQVKRRSTKKSIKKTRLFYSDVIPTDSKYFISDWNNIILNK